MKFLKAILLISAAVTVILRLFVYENSAVFVSEITEILNIISYTAAGICLISALIWILIIKKEEKKNGKNKES